MYFYWVERISLIKILIWWHALCLCSPVILVLSPFDVTQFQGETPKQGPKIYLSLENLQLANISLYLGNGTRQAHSYYGTLMGTRRYPFDLCEFK